MQRSESQTFAAACRVDDYLGCQRDLGRRVVLGDAEAEVERHRGQIYSFRAHKLQTYSVLQSKAALSGLDDKRVLLDGGATTLALGHWRITRMRQSRRHRCDNFETIL